ncbi:IS1096 element passenger TnpR family protein [Burkholderia diffusa]
MGLHEFRPTSAPPPEDVGGVLGYADFLEAIPDPTHEEHDHFLERS